MDFGTATEATKLLISDNTVRVAGIAIGSITTRTRIKIKGCILRDEKRLTAMARITSEVTRVCAEGGNRFRNLSQISLKRLMISAI